MTHSEPLIKLPDAIHVPSVSSNALNGNPETSVVLQVKLLESYKKVAKEDVRRDAAEGKCVPMEAPDTAARQWELAEQQRAWQEALEHENLITYRKQAGSAVLGQDDQDVQLSLDSNADWSQEGNAVLLPCAVSIMFSCFCCVTYLQKCR